MGARSHLRWLVKKCIHFWWVGVVIYGHQDVPFLVVSFAWQKRRLPGKKRRLPGKKASIAWQIGDVFKRGGGGELSGWDEYTPHTPDFTN